MPAKRAARAKAPAQDQGLTKAAACKVLQVAPTADEELITQAYWHLARKVRVHAHRDPEARRQLDELNRAYLVLNPARAEAPLSAEAPPLDPDQPNEFVAWLKKLVQQVAERWPRRTPEVAILSATT
ncbi:MAG: DnaJ domain-containing protein, partial [Dehalococcoidia bacterium]|nr:DnaJ domain-containing protein [Dehalococcoidia bacterium]